jgi:hypothetical protein
MTEKANAIRIIHLRQMGRRDFNEGRPMIIPAFLKDQGERTPTLLAMLARSDEAIWIRID